MQWWGKLIISLTVWFLPLSGLVLNQHDACGSGPFVCYVSLLHHVKIQIERKLKRKRKQKRNGGSNLRGASRPRRFLRLRFCFRFRVNSRLTWTSKNGRREVAWQQIGFQLGFYLDFDLEFELEKTLTCCWKANNCCKKFNAWKSGIFDFSLG